MKLRLLAIGDVTGSAGVEYLKKNLRRRIDEWEVDLTVVNGENAADVHGISERDVHDIFAAGADVITPATTPSAGATFTGSTRICRGFCAPTIFRLRRPDAAALS